MIDKEKPKAVICDIDGTIADCSHRRSFDMNGKLDKIIFYDKNNILWDRPKIEILDIIKGLRLLGYHILFISARREEYRAVTLKWLKDACEINIDDPFIKLFLKKNDDSQPDHVVKEEIILPLLEEYNIMQAFDDRKGIINRLWERFGICAMLVR